jgi:hypothetical protein
MIFKGSCHCGRIAFEVEGEIAQVVECNCSICSRKGSLLWFVPRAQLRLSTPEEAMSTYRFGKQAISHRFCPTCGMHPFAEGADPAGNRIAAVNVRCLDGIDLSAIPVTQVNGRDR